MIGEKEYLDNLHKLVKSTEGGVLNWQKSNPTTYFLKRTDGQGKVVNLTLQKINKPLIETRGSIPASMSYYILFQIIELRTKNVIINIDGKLSSDIRHILKKLFKLVEYSIEKRNIDYLDDLLSDL